MVFESETFGKLHSSSERSAFNLPIVEMPEEYPHPPSFRENECPLLDVVKYSNN
jgi:hypothetical protein